MLILFCIINYLCGPFEFDYSLNIISSVGSFISGVAAVIASAAAVMAMNAWVHKLKTSEHLSCIWAANTKLSKLQGKFGEWYVVKYPKRDEQSDEVERLENVLKNSFIDFENSCHSLESVVTKERDSWVVEAKFISSIYNDIKNYLENNPRPDDSAGILKENEELLKLTNKIFMLFGKLIEEIDKLENQYS